MAHKRKEFSDKTKAAIFVRDRATCCFSGANLWLIEAPLRPGAQCDWVDHIKPSARGGGNSASNGVCASHSYNQKKGNNSRDTLFQFFGGKPTYEYFEIFGVPSSEVNERLDRLANLRPEDWYLNRAIKNVLHAFDVTCYIESGEIAPKRQSPYWMSAALKKLGQYKRLAGDESLEQRGITTPNIHDPRWLELRAASSLEHLTEITQPLLGEYRINYQAWWKYFYDAETKKEFKKARKAAHSTAGVSADVIACIDSDFASSPDG